MRFYHGGPEANCEAHAGSRVGASAAVIAAGLAFGLAAEEDAGGEENGRDGGVGQSDAQMAVAHSERRVQEPNRGTEIPDPIEISAHSTLGCAAWRGRYLLILMAKRLFRKTPERAGLFQNGGAQFITESAEDTEESGCVIRKLAVSKPTDPAATQQAGARLHPQNSQRAQFVAL